MRLDRLRMVKSFTNLFTVSHSPFIPLPAQNVCKEMISVFMFRGEEVTFAIEYEMNSNSMKEFQGFTGT
jgi:hypothetical protein